MHVLNTPSVCFGLETIVNCYVTISSEQFCRTFNFFKSGEVGPAVVEALRQGYRLIDCAHYYGNEEEIGEE